MHWERADWVKGMWNWFDTLVFLCGAFDWVRGYLLDQRLRLDAALLHRLLGSDRLALLLGRGHFTLFLLLGLQNSVGYVFVLLELPQLGNPRRELLQRHGVCLLVGSDEVSVVAGPLRKARLEVRERLGVRRRRELVDGRLGRFHLLCNLAMDE